MKKLQRFIKEESLSGVLLFAGMVCALLLSNSFLYEHYLTFIHLPITIKVGDASLSKPLIKWMNDGFMALFFLMLTLESKYHLAEEDLIDRSTLKLAAVAALGGAIVPALIYYSLNYNDSTNIKGWAIPIATDTAFILGIISFFKNKVPFKARLFILWLSIIDDVLAVLIIAIFYTPSLDLSLIHYAVLLILALWVLNFFNVKFIWPYLILGFLLWLVIVETGVHGTLAGVILGAFIPSRILTTTHTFESPLKKLEHHLHPFVAFIVLPLFAFLNCEISFKELEWSDLTSRITIGIVLGLFLGKQIGVFICSYLYIRVAKTRLPFGLTWSAYYAISVLTGIGFTFSLFIGLLSFESETLIDQMKIGVLIATFLSAFWGAFILLISPSKPSALEEPMTP
jgi:NhaA family Na+:H+ antiporter